MKLQREMEIDSLEQMCDLMCGGVEEEYEEELSFEDEVDYVISLGASCQQSKCYVSNYLDKYICLEHNGGCKGIDVCREINKTFYKHDIVKNRVKAFKQYDMNKQRALSIATKFIPKDSIKLYYAELCNGCKCNNNKQEYLECCCCQNGSYYEEEKEENNVMKIEKCNHRDSKGNPTIKYDSSYEMRGSEMHCTQCGKEGTREELWNDEVIEDDYDLTEEYSDLLSGQLVWLESDELRCILDNMNEIGINTLMVQTCKDKFVCKVDEPTIREWRKLNAKI